MREEMVAAEERAGVLRTVAKRVSWTALGIVAGCLGVLTCDPGRRCAGLSERLPLPSAPHITRRIGNSLAQLLTSKAVLIAAGLAAVGGGSDWIFCSGAVDVRRRGGAGRGGAIAVACGVGDGSGTDATSGYGTGVEFGLSGLVGGLVGFCDCAVRGVAEGDGRIVGVDGPDGCGGPSPVWSVLGLALLLVSGLL